MNRSAMAYVATFLGSEYRPLIARCIVEDTPDGCRILVDGGSGPHWFPREGVGQITETDYRLELTYSRADGQLGEVGLRLEPVTVERWNDLAAIRSEMTPVLDFDELAERLRGF